MNKIYPSRLTSGAFVFALIVSLLILTASNPLAAKETDVAGIVFSEIEKRIISDFFNERSGQSKIKGKHKKSKSKKGLPPGLARKDSLPPGLAKQLARNGTLPPGLAKRQLPSGLFDRLPGRSNIFERVIVGNDILLMKRGADLIYDIIKGAINK